MRVFTFFLIQITVLFAPIISYSHLYFYAIEYGEVYQENDKTSKILGSFKKGEWFLFRSAENVDGKESDLCALHSANQVIKNGVPIDWELKGYALREKGIIVYLPLPPNLANIEGDLDRAAQKRVQEINEWKKAEERIKEERIARERREKEEEYRREGRIKTFKPEIRRAIKEKKIMLGMTTEQVLYHGISLVK